MSSARETRKIIGAHVQLPPLIKPLELCTSLPSMFDNMHHAVAILFCTARFFRSVSPWIKWIPGYYLAERLAAGFHNVSLPYRPSQMHFCLLFHCFRAGAFIYHPQLRNETNQILNQLIEGTMFPMHTHTPPAPGTIPAHTTPATETMPAHTMTAQNMLAGVPTQAISTVTTPTTAPTSQSVLSPNITLDVEF